LPGRLKKEKKTEKKVQKKINDAKKIVEKAIEPTGLAKAASDTGGRGWRKGDHEISFWPKGEIGAHPVGQALAKTT